MTKAPPTATAVQAPTMRLPRLRPDQQEIASDPAHIKVVAMGRRWGKTLTCGTIALSVASAGGEVAWVVPTYRNARPVWRFAEAHVSPLGKLIRINRADMTITFPNGGWLGIYSADNDVAMRGMAFDLVVAEEAAQFQESTLTDVIMPTLADRDGRLILISTPYGRNFFYREWVTARADRSGRRKAWTAPTSANPMPTIQRAFEEARTKVSSRTFRQEWLAEFLEDGGMVFRSVDSCVRHHVHHERCPEDCIRWEHDCRLDGCDPEEPCKEKFPADVYEGQFVCGLDWGRDYDFTDITVLDARTRREVDHQRFTDVGFELQKTFIKSVALKWHNAYIVAEENSIGDPNIEALQRDGLHIEGVFMTNKSKSELVEDLVLQLEQGHISLGDKPENEELRAYQQEKLPSGMIRYGAPHGIHDDYVTSLMLANSACEAESVPVDFQFWT